MIMMNNKEMLRKSVETVNNTLALLLLDQETVNNKHQFST